jgi:hypothetical protein
MVLRDQSLAIRGNGLLHVGGEVDESQSAPMELGRRNWRERVAQERLAGDDGEFGGE